jgi:hypothetical protein
VVRKLAFQKEGKTTNKTIESILDIGKCSKGNQIRYNVWRKRLAGSRLLLGKN